MPSEYCTSPLVKYSHYAYILQSKMIFTLGTNANHYEPQITYCHHEIQYSEQNTLSLLNVAFLIILTGMLTGCSKGKVTREQLNELSVGWEVGMIMLV
jgi:hypothetical protein